MPFLQLKDIGKIYVSDGNVSVGIRNVNLSFERGEFVAITGTSGSGKSTLLNVISGMDTYEEGELFIEGNPTSHYIQTDWEEYREKYISFIFQDYNIIESFTVLQNVELSLMSIDNPIERRRRAIELLKRVGMDKHLKQKGSKLSGGQKQRCVIARALAKDSPIILADEPTGNLDAQSSKEIIELLREVSKDKLLIIVTHNFDEVEAYATRHIRVFDGAIESDHAMNTDSVMPAASVEEFTGEPDKGNRMVLRNGLRLGWATFLAKPRLTAFICLILTLGLLGTVVLSFLMGDVFAIFKPFRMFEPKKGRVIVSHRTGSEFTEAELEELVEKYQAKSYMRYDAILDAKVVLNYDCYVESRRFGKDITELQTISFGAAKGKYCGSPSIGRYPEEKNEILIYVPISFQSCFGKDEINEKVVDDLKIGAVRYEIVGVKYYINNSKQPKIVFSDAGYEKLSKVVANNFSLFVELESEESFLDFGNIKNTINSIVGQNDSVYNQASLFFKNDRAAVKAAKKMRNDGFLAVDSKVTYNPDVLDVMQRIVDGVTNLIVWFVGVLFLAFFVNLCIHRSLDVIKNDLTIFRSMGISVRIIKASLYMRMLISIIPGILVTAALAVFVFLSPNYNSICTFLSWWQYLLILAGMIIITCRVTKKQIHRLFDKSVKKTLKGGEEA